MTERMESELKVYVARMTRDGEELSEIGRAHV